MGTSLMRSPLASNLKFIELTNRYLGMPQETDPNIFTKFFAKNIDSNSKNSNPKLKKIENKISMNQIISKFQNFTN